jgi:FG-GAP-like repeat
LARQLGMSSHRFTHPRRPALARVVVVLVAVFAWSSGSASAFPLVEPPEHVDSPPGFPIAVLDFNGDGLLDLASGGNADVRLALGTAMGFAEQQTVPLAGAQGDRPGLVAAELTGDDYEDLVLTTSATASLVLVRGRADGVLTAPPPEDVDAFGAAGSDGRPVSVDVGDVDGDEDLDVVAGLGVDADSNDPPNTEENGTVSVFTNSGDGALTQTAQQPLAVNAPGDVLLLPLAGDNDPDLIVAQTNRSSVKVFPGADGASFGAGVSVDGGPSPWRLDWADFDNDGQFDIVVSSEQASASILPGGADPATLGPRIGVADADGQYVGAADLDRDGLDDLYVADGRPPLPFPGASDDPIFLQGHGDLTFGARDQPLRQFSRSEYDPQFADIDGDDKLDVVTGGTLESGGTAYLIRYGLGPQLVPGPSAVDFARHALGTRSSAEQVLFTNIGPGTAAGITGFAVGDAAEFPVVSETCTGAVLAVGQSCALSIAFNPLALGGRFLFRSVYAGDADYLYGVDLYGEGVAGPTRNPSPPASSAPDVQPRAAKLASPSIALKTLRRRGLRFTQFFPEAGRARWTLEFPHGARVLARVARTIDQPGTARVRLKPTRRRARLLTRRRPSRLLLRTVFTAPGEPPDVLVATVRIRR